MTLLSALSAYWNEYGTPNFRSILLPFSGDWQPRLEVTTFRMCYPKSGHTLLEVCICHIFVLWWSIDSGIYSLLYTYDFGVTHLKGLWPLIWVNRSPEEGQMIDQKFEVRLNYVLTRVEFRRELRESIWILLDGVCKSLWFVWNIWQFTRVSWIHLRESLWEWTLGLSQKF